MKVRSLILGACAAGVAVTGAVASLFGGAQATKYVQYNGTFYSAGTTISCPTGSARCQAKTVDRQGVTLSTATTLFSAQATNSPIAGTGTVQGTVVIPIN